MNGRLRWLPHLASVPAMRSLTIRKCLTFLTGLAALTTAAVAQLPSKMPGDDTNGAFVRVLRNADGSREEFRRIPGDKTLVKTTYSAPPKSTVRMVTVYKMDAQGNPRSCKIYDGAKQELFKVSYGYDKTYGRIVEEHMFDSRVKRIDPASNKEKPVRIFRYTYDAQGNRGKPISIVLIPGKLADDIFGAGSALERNPFNDDKAANPRSKPVGNR